MKRILISIVLLFFVFQSIQAQSSLKKTAITFTNNLNSGVIYSVNNSNRTEGHYVITKSKIEIPIAYESFTNYSAEDNSKNQTDTITSHSKFSDQGLASLQTFAVFTVVNTNSLPNTVSLDETYTLSPHLKSHLPEGFNPYNGMFADNAISKALQHPITAR